MNNENNVNVVTDSGVNESTVTENYAIFNSNDAVLGNDYSPDWDVTSEITGLDKYILVAAINYETGNSFINQLNNYKAKIKNKKSSALIIIDLNKGTIRTIIDGKQDKIESYDAISKANYPSGHHFDPLGKSNYITKNTIYDIIVKIGENDSNTLVEASIFSHAYWEGPILVNSNASDPIDIDMRISDISPSIFNFTHFKNAFKTDGKFKIFGCQSHPPFNYLLKAIMKNSKYKKNGGISDTDEFVIDDLRIPKPHGGGNYDPVSSFIPPTLYTDLGNGKIKLIFSDIKTIFSSSYCENFAAKLAVKVDITVQYSLPATYASFGQPEYFRISKDTEMNVPFYSTYLGVKIGELKYGLYDKVTVTLLQP